MLTALEIRNITLLSIVLCLCETIKGNTLILKSVQLGLTCTAYYYHLKCQCFLAC